MAGSIVGPPLVGRVHERAGTLALCGTGEPTNRMLHRCPGVEPRWSHTALPPAPAPTHALQVTKASLADKIAQLNAAIDDVSAQLKAQDNAAPTKEEVMAN